MSDVVHHVMIVTASGWAFDQNLGVKSPPDVTAFYEQLPGKFRYLLNGPTKSLTNDYWTWTFGPCGSKVGWDLEKEFSKWADKFVDLFSFRFDDGSSPFEVIQIHYGRDSEGQYQVDAIVKNPA